jgi:lysozyme
MPSLSTAGLALVKSFEGYRAEAVRLPDGRWLMGYGHVRSGPPAIPIGEREAEQILKEDLEAIAQGLRACVLVALTDSQFDALVSFAFSIGLPAFERSEVLRRLNAGEQVAAATAMDLWRASAASGELVVLDALVRRRAVEKALFLDQQPRTPATSALVRPDIDQQPTAEARQRREDETARKLREILAREPQTAAALAAPDVVEEEEDEAPPAATRVDQPQRDLVGYGALGALGLLLIAMGVTGAADDHGVAHIIFTIPGVIAAAMSAFYLLKRAGA